MFLPNPPLSEKNLIPVMGKSEEPSTETKTLMVLTGIWAGAGVGHVLGMGQTVRDTVWPVNGTVWPLRCCRGSVQTLVVPVPAQTQALIGIQGGCSQGTGPGCATIPVSAVGSASSP